MCTVTFVNPALPHLFIGGDDEPAKGDDGAIDGVEEGDAAGVTLVRVVSDDPDQSERLTGLGGGRLVFGR